jgi:hypothetical protein
MAGQYTGLIDEDGYRFSKESELLGNIFEEPIPKVFSAFECIPDL